ncbi:NADH-quinone oxidoreductase subunit N [Streptantibioticus ferralitis]|uniref:NADH-quinone oxidoreductase subunit N n=1 Tax=Streptantibioticus ferralitis TaxID=236510 RepID=A0ABT5Z6K5_9ACTN|nr:NADH-quinone oxidoreductase subunit N [Streptantibioticus ferralitis]MDF2259444.1 NADH-quinone oxidoreductase subunit N [Streptantibioticus ferralitis]
MTDLAGGLVQSIDWLAVAPPTILAVVALAVLVADLFVDEARRPLLGWAAVGGLVLAGLSLLPLLNGARTTFCLTTGAHNCSYVADHFTLAIQLLVIGGALLTALLSLHNQDRLPTGEFWFLLLSSAAGAALLPASRDLATLVVALEVVSLPSFALVGLRRSDRLSSEAALKFFLSSVTATAVMLLGVSFVYAATGTLHLGALSDGLTHAPAQLVTLAKTGAVLTLVGFAFKLGVAPFHFWVPDTYAGAPLPVAAYLSVVGKAAGFSGLILVTVIAFKPYGDVWGPALAVLAALTMTVGNVAALRQRPEHPRSAVRLLAWSSIGQAGYLLVPLAAAGYVADPRHQIGATVSYALMYTVVNLGAFGVAALVLRSDALNRITDYRGLYARRPLAALALAFFLLCLAGLPPGIIGLFAKVVVFSSAVDAGLGWLAVIMAVNVVIALYYYLRWTALLFVRPEPVPGEAAAVRTPASLTAAIAAAAVVGIALSGAPQLVLRFASGSLF